MATEQAKRTALTRDGIVAAAVSFVDEEGLVKLSMRKLAEALGSGVMSLYNHVTDKDDLLEGMLDTVVGEVATPVEGGDWRVAMGATATSLHDTLSSHPWACDLWHTTFPGPHRTSLMEGILRCFREAGFSPRMAHHGFHVVDLYVVGHVHQAAAFTLGVADPEATMARFMEQTPADQFPYMIEHVAQHDGDETEDGFAFMLGLLFDGLERHIGDG